MRRCKKIGISRPKVKNFSLSVQRNLDVRRVRRAVLRRAGVRPARRREAIPPRPAAVRSKSDEIGGIVDQTRSSRLALCVEGTTLLEKFDSYQKFSKKADCVSSAKRLSTTQSVFMSKSTRRDPSGRTPTFHNRTAYATVGFFMKLSVPKYKCHFSRPNAGRTPTFGSHPEVNAAIE